MRSPQCLAVIGPAAASTASVRKQDDKAKQNARNLVSEVESCYTETMDYSKCDSKSELSQDQAMGLFSVPIGKHPGQARVRDATSQKYTVDAYSRSGNHFLFVKAADGRLARKCTKRGRGGCPKSGVW